ncbi:bacteriophage abortive infection AbiH family protein [Polaribacter litorisediminis]|uniref:AbiH family protein n=1 Tax=Polaribacter litorisediminis TaxID=1908341 RepID=UPI001CBFFC2A|nr:AbiH family protein [Polaribacter litorisediminis]UAM97022.1 bacteriophage abortive infection AbiH family protein [Polaribacter litorisediminis]
MSKKERIYNRLILVGNGFDLALGMKTSYNDFLFWYLKNLLITSVKKNQRFDDRNMSTKYFYYKDELTTTYWKSFNHQDKLLEFIDRHDTLEKLQKLLNENSPVNIACNSLLFKSIYDSSLNSWVDIERTYYDILKSNLKEKKEVEKLNNNFSFLKNQLEIYLISLEIPAFADSGKSTLFSEQFFGGVTHEEMIDASPEDSIGRKDILLLNFNYTNSLSQLLKNVEDKYQPKINYTINHIHGKLNSTEEKMIFGYGDEMDDKYKEIQDLNDNLYLENIKSFQYFRSPNYRSLLRFVSSNEYQVCIYGHSCGLSDRVMLNEIFENENCKSIKIYFYKDENDFNNKTMEISRHFKDNNSMRKKIVNFNPKDIMPQLTN